MSGVQFNIAISVLFVGYILGQIPSNLILSMLSVLFAAHWPKISLLRPGDPC